MKLKGWAPIRSTEDPQKVLLCILNIFPICEYEISKEKIDFSTGDIDRFIEILREQQIRDTALMILEKGLEGDTSSFFLNKQAAFMEKVNFTEGDSILGDLEITIIDGALELKRSITPSVD
jgi:predicted RNA binding protein with dsRBD fold (UPF0201 family)